MTDAFNMQTSTQQFKRRILLSSVVGNALEFYDFMLCGVFVSMIGRVFFPVQDEFAQILSGLSVFAAAFLTRPLGAFVFGYIGDRYGRKKALTWSVTLMGIPTLIISILPSYETIGIIAPIILMLCRLLQGLCTGGEYNGAAIFALEHLKTKPGMVSGWVSGSCAIGALAAMLMGYIMLDLTPWSWRVPFFLGAAISALGYFIRRNTLETVDFLNLKADITTAPILKVWKDDRKSLTLAAFLGFFNGVLSYTLFSFLAIYMKKYVGCTLSQGLYYNLFGLLAFMCLCPVFGGYSDQISPFQSLRLAGKLAIILPGICFALFQLNNELAFVIGQLLLGLVVASYLGPCHYFLQTLFPVANRYTGAALGFTIGMAIAGVTTQMILIWGIETFHNLYFPPLYIAFHGVIWLCVLHYLGSKIKIHYKNIAPS